MDWLVGKGATPSQYTGPTRDHTTGGIFGQYMFVEASFATVGHKARLVTGRFHATTGNGFCIKFWYNMYGVNIGTLNVIVKNRAGNATERILWSLSGNQKWGWRQGQAPVVSSRDSYQVVFEAILAGGVRGDIAIDDITYISGTCTVSPSTALPVKPTTKPATPIPTTPGRGQFDCNFESGFCTWSQGAGARFNWTRQQGKTSSINTGPSQDHTLKNNNGSYIYAEASSPRRPGDKAILVSQQVPANSRPGNCIIFWYHMFGAHVGALNLYIQTGSGALPKPTWTRNGTQGNEWKRGMVFYPSIQSSKILFEAVRGRSYAGDIALDDLQIKSGFCPPADACSFEQNNLCGWKNEPTKDDFDWTRATGGTASVNTGPSADHTFGTSKGYYMYIEATGKSRGDKAQLLSPRYPKTTGRCLQFWYHMYGSDMGTLTVYKKVLTSGSSYNIRIWWRSGDKSNIWRIGRVSVWSSTYDYQAVFEGVVGRSFRGDIAIDDVKLLDGKCPPAGNCDFESDTCTWTNSLVGDTFDWRRNKGSTLSGSTGPSVDHTRQDSSGYYMYIEASSPRRRGDIALLTSEEFFRTSSSGRCIKFWYHMYGKSIGSLNIYYKTNVTKQIIWGLSGQQTTNRGSGGWKFGQAPIRSNVVYQIIFEGIIGTSHTGDIAVDDIRFTTSACSILPSSVTVTPAPPPTTVPTIPGSTPAPSPYDCNFDVGTCQWTYDSTADFQWSRKNHGTPSTFTGPDHDHTTND
ncbi:MAM and LDL-receptor class A domain-containing 2-like, partial [Paramuricea clavata]